LKPFDPLNFRLEGTSLIEASAGTGKTYTIENLFVRLVLEKQLPVDHILVVTFTKAATEELKDRIRDKLARTRNAFIRGASEDLFVDTIVKRYPQAGLADRLLQQAIIDFDKSAIFTIHGFCQRVLYENAFETGSRFDTELIPDQANLLQEVTDDFWRKHFYHALPELISYASTFIKGPHYFYQLLSTVKAPDIKIVPDIAQPEIKSIQPYRSAFAELRAAWADSRPDVIQQLSDPSLNARTFGSLKTHKDYPEMTEREFKIFHLSDAMDRFVDGNHTVFPVFNGFEKFTTSVITRATRKNQVPPNHRFFGLCDDLFAKASVLKTELDQYILFLKVRLLASAQSELEKRKKDKNIQYFDDLLQMVRRALRAKGGRSLVDVIRRKYKAALVDEFQDTDNLQYEIFAKLFSGGDHLLIMIGDPKQAIYSFRGADIFSYMEAARNADAKFTLTENWRSAPGLVKAVNTLFYNVSPPFIFKEIVFEESQPAAMNARVGSELKPGLILWYLDSRQFSDKDKPINKSDAVRFIADAVAGEISALIDSTSEACSAGDIAVLVRTNRQARLIKQVLSARRIASVLYSAENVFDSPEAMEMEKILSSIADPANSARLKTALVMNLLGTKAEDLITANQESTWWETRLARNREYSRLWNDHGFIRMFRTFLAKEQVKQRLLSFTDGERRLTNVLHLAEILHRKSVEQNLGMTGLLKWLAEQRDPNSLVPEEHPLRLESDEQAVKIVTIHKSKGLEYPIVFCPFGWESSLINKKDFTFHDLDDKRRLTIDLGAEINARHIAWAQKEVLSENLRLLYVALTRAKKRCYLAWGRIHTAETSALAYILHCGNDTAASSPDEDQVLSLHSRISHKTDEELLADLKGLADRSDHSIQIIPLAAFSGGVDDSVRAKSSEPLCSRKFVGKIDRSWKIASYSSLVSHRAADPDLPDRDAAQASIGHSEVSVAEGSDIFSFPKGAGAGIFFHDIFEHLNFTEFHSLSRHELVSKKLAQHGFNQIWQKAVLDMIANVMSIPLQPHPDGFTLSAVSNQNRINEMEFYFPVNSIRPSMLSQIFKEHGNMELRPGFSDRLEKLTFAPSAGFMKGYIDMIFQHRGRFYLLDWKSNYLGPTIDSYDQTAIHKTMQEDYYILQSHIYTLALHLYLRLRKPDYRYEIDFGGVFYIFLRGVAATHGPQYGIFSDRPIPQLIDALGNALIPAYS
jgi:exodeoxyribonuclease V beta subunit